MPKKIAGIHVDTESKTDRYPWIPKAKQIGVKTKLLVPGTNF